MHVQHVPAPRHAGVPRRARQRVALPLPVPRLVVPQRRRARRACRSTRTPTAASDGLRREGDRRCCPRRARRDLQRADLRQPRPGRRRTSRSTSATSRFYLDFYTRQSAGGLELRGPQRWRVKANWKIGAENFAGDRYHTPHTHASVVEIGLFREPEGPASARRARSTSPGRRRHDVQAAAGRLRGAAALRRLPARDDRPPCAEPWSAEQQALDRRDDGFMLSAATLFPNLSFVHNWPQVDEDGLVVAVHLDPPVAAGRARRDRGAVVVRRRPRRARVVQARLRTGPT